MNFLNILITTILTIISFLIHLILLPIDLLISTFIPDLASGFSSIGELLTMMMTYIGWAVSASGVPYATITLVILYVVFKLTVPIQVWVIKLALNWYHILKF